jgi:NADP-dependent 3-hydroxy acid dehydrogenase YdfG
MPLSPLHEIKVGEWDQMIDVNIRGVLQLTAGRHDDQLEFMKHVIEVTKARSRQR